MEADLKEEISEHETKMPDDDLEKREVIKFGITLFSIITIITIAATIIGLNVDRDYDEILYGDDCGGCDDDYYNESSIIDYKGLWGALNERQENLYFV